MPNVELEGDQSRIFKASRYWTSNVWGAVLAGLGGGILMLAVAIIVLSGAWTLKMMLLMGGWVLILLLTVLASFPGNAIARFPYEVVIEKGKGLRLHAPFKELYIPIQDLRDVRSSFLQGFVVRLKRRHGLLTQIVIHRFFGRQGPPLADAIRDEIQRHAS